MKTTTKRIILTGVGLEIILLLSWVIFPNFLHSINIHDTYYLFGWEIIGVVVFLLFLLILSIKLLAEKILKTRKLYRVFSHPVILNLGVFTGLTSCSRS